jgi:hypothetical protein
LNNHRPAYLANLLAPSKRSHDTRAAALVLVLVWLAVLLGFGKSIFRHIETGAPPYPWIIHVHALVFAAWLILFTAQVALARMGRIQAHRKLGSLMLWSPLVLLVVGVATALGVQAHNFGTPRSDPAFLSVQVGDLFGFLGLYTAALMLRKDLSAHQRLMVLALLHASTSGFARSMGGLIGEWAHVGNWGQSFWQTFLILHGANDVLALVYVAHDRLSNGRLHRALAWGLPFSLGMQAVQVWLYVTPAWKPVATWLLNQ